VRVLSVPWAKPDAARPLIRLFIDLAADRRYGTTRRMIVLALGKTRNARAKAAAKREGAL
jgi:hypothetical protein